MIISHKKKFVFLHNPKVAGSAIRQALEPLHDDHINYWHQRFIPELDRVVDAAHLTFHDLCILKPNLKHWNYTFFSVVRNPYDRFLSALSEHQRQHSMCINSIDKWIGDHMSEVNFRFNWKYIHFCPQHYFVPTIEKDRVTKYVARHETLADDWKWLNTVLETDLQLPQVRVRPDPVKMGPLSDYAVAMINMIYAEDFRRFGYKMRGNVIAKCVTHSERVTAIHSPYLNRPNYDDCTSGEQIAYNQVYGDPYGD